MTLDTGQLARSLKTLESSLQLLHQAAPDSIEYEVFRNATIKGFELTLETAGKLLRKAVKRYEANPKEVDALVFKDVLRHAGKHGMLELEAIERWFAYRDNRNSTAYDYGEAFAKETLMLLTGFQRDVAALIHTLTALPGNDA